MHALMMQPLRRTLTIGFGTVAMLTLALGWFAYREVTTLSSFIERIYRHPYTVGIEIRELEIDVVKMHRGMKDVMLASTPEAVNRYVAIVNAMEKEGLERIPLLLERFLGDPVMIKNVERAILDWRPIRAEVLAAVHGGERAKAIEINMGRAAAQVEAIGNAMDVLQKAADQRAQTLIAEANEERTQATTISLVLSAAALLFSILIGFGISLMLSRPIDALRKAMAQLAGNDLTTDIPYTAAGNEMGAMARAVEVFKTNGIEREKLRSDAGREEETRAMRQALMEESISSFEAGASAVIATLSAASAELQASSESMTSAAEDTKMQSATVASAAEEASVNVHSVTAAGEELSASISEILRQTQASSTATSEA
ncbi:MAG: HAMP domain-containing protein, partial [Bosea sp. (in: a-proteobacteria)]